MKRSSKRRSKRPATRTSTTRVTKTSRTSTTKVSSTAYWVAGIALAAAAATGTALYLTKGKAAATPSPALPPPGVTPPSPSPAPPSPAPGPAPTPGVSPSTLPQTGDVFQSLTPAQQAAVQQSLYSYITESPSLCPTVLQAADIAADGITSGASLAYGGSNYQAAVNCFQNGSSVGQTPGAGELDVQTYSQLMGLSG
jgi:hypothetical protein